MTADEVMADAQLIWKYHQMNHVRRPADIGIGLGSHDLGVATFAAHLFHQGLFPTLVFTGGNSPSTAAYFPRGEAIHYRDHAIKLGVPATNILVEPLAMNTGQNIAFTRDLLAGTAVKSVLLISKPYMERRAFATCRKIWPDVQATCVSDPIDLVSYIDTIGDAGLVLSMLVGDLQRVIDYPARGFAIEQKVAPDVLSAYERLIAAGYTSRLAT
ncbi:YdcF family protein [Kribbella albertanoniae]|uniref:YdcF family protein n=1 Tax=Kribbella albertanoniae TaxID=1266829 RepID=A0A4R4QDG3_9ACTN|nr:YdcF family protein [Kribbella albertanoniae]TDC33173.1 YdcF family protein [Kribbella albertanoniae]